MAVPGYENYFHGKENAETARRLAAGEDCVVIGYGQSMTPIMKSGQPAFVRALTPETKLEKDDIVLCKVNGHHYLHKIWAVKGPDSFLIGNNHGHANGTVGRRNIFGIVEKIL